MEKIKLQDIDLVSMKLCGRQGSTSDIYVDEDKCYKIFTDLSCGEKTQLLEKFYEMDGISIDGILLPKELIFKDSKLMGYTMDYFPDSVCLNDYFTKDRFIDVNDIFLEVKKVSKILRQAHEKDVILQDFSFDNVLIDNNNNIKICDIDGCYYKGNGSPFISMIMHHYYEMLMGNRVRIDKNFDRQALLFSMLVAIYHKTVLNMKDYDLLSDKIETLKSIRNLIQSLFISARTEVPYLDDIIVDDDHFIIDRNKQVSLEKRLAKDYSIF